MYCIFVGIVLLDRGEAEVVDTNRSLYMKRNDNSSSTLTQWNGTHIILHQDADNQTGHKFPYQCISSLVTVMFLSFVLFLNYAIADLAVIVFYWSYPIS